MSRTTIRVVTTLVRSSQEADECLAYPKGPIYSISIASHSNSQRFPYRGCSLQGLPSENLVTYRVPCLGLSRYPSQGRPRLGLSTGASRHRHRPLAPPPPSLGATVRGVKFDASLLFRIRVPATPNPIHHRPIGGREQRELRMVSPRTQHATRNTRNTRNRQLVCAMLATSAASSASVAAVGLLPLSCR